MYKSGGADIESNGVLKVLYMHIKFEFYLENILSKKWRVMLAKLKISSHFLRIETFSYGRDRIDRQDHICTLCSMELEDKYHFIIMCPLYQDIRTQYIKKYYYIKPSMVKFVTLFESPNKAILVGLSKFISFAMKRRNEHINR